MRVKHLSQRAVGVQPAPEQQQVQKAQRLPVAEAPMRGQYLASCPATPLLPWRSRQVMQQKKQQQQHQGDEIQPRPPPQDPAPAHLRQQDTLPTPQAAKVMYPLETSLLKDPRGMPQQMGKVSRPMMQGQQEVVQGYTGPSKRAAQPSARQQVKQRKKQQQQHQGDEIQPRPPPQDPAPAHLMQQDTLPTPQPAKVMDPLETSLLKNPRGMPQQMGKVSRPMMQGQQEVVQGYTGPSKRAAQPSARQQVKQRKKQQQQHQGAEIQPRPPPQDPAPAHLMQQDTLPTPQAAKVMDPLETSLLKDPRGMPQQMGKVSRPMMQGQQEVVQGYTGPSKRAAQPSARQQVKQRKKQQQQHQGDEIQPRPPPQDPAPAHLMQQDTLPTPQPAKVMDPLETSLLKDPRGMPQQMGKVSRPMMQGQQEVVQGYTGPSKRAAQPSARQQVKQRKKQQQQHQGAEIQPRPPPQDPAPAHLMQQDTLPTPQAAKVMDPLETSLLKDPRGMPQQMGKVSRPMMQGQQEVVQGYTGPSKRAAQPSARQQVKQRKKQQQQHQGDEIQPRPPPQDPARAHLMQQDTLPTPQAAKVMDPLETSLLKDPTGMPQQMGKVSRPMMQGQQQVVQGNAEPSKRAAQPSARQQVKQRKKQQQQHQGAEIQPRPPPQDPAPAHLMQQDTLPTPQAAKVMDPLETSPLKDPTGMPQQMGKVSRPMMQGQQQVVQGYAGPSNRAAQPSARQQVKQRKKQQQQHQGAEIQPRPPPQDPARAHLMQQDTLPTPQAAKVMDPPETSPLKDPSGMPQQMGKVSRPMMQGQQQVVQGNAEPSKRAAQPSARQQVKQRKKQQQQHQGDEIQPRPPPQDPARAHLMQQDTLPTQVRIVNKSECSTPSVREQQNQLACVPGMRRSPDIVMMAPGGAVITAVEGPAPREPQIKQHHKMNQQLASPTFPHLHKLNSTISVITSNGAGKKSTQHQQHHQGISTDAPFRVLPLMPQQVQLLHQVRRQNAADPAPSSAPGSSPGSAQAQQRQPVAVHSPNSARSSFPYECILSVPRVLPLMSQQVQSQHQIRRLIAAGSAPSSARGSAPGSAQAQQRQTVAVPSPYSVRSSFPYEGNLSVPRGRSPPRQLAPARGARAPPPIVDLTSEDSPPTALPSMMGRGTGGQGQELPKRYWCSFCTMQCSTLQELVLHLQTYHRLDVQSSDLGIPVVDKQNPADIHHLNSLGICDFVPSPLPERDTGRNLFIPLLVGNYGRFSVEAIEALQSGLFKYAEEPQLRQ